MSIKKKVLLSAISFIFFFICCTVTDQSALSEPAAASANCFETVIIDAGHGGFDGGATAPDGTPEKDINLKIAKKLTEILRFNGFHVIMTRETDEGTETNPQASVANRKKSDMAERLRIMNENPEAVFVSIHLNKFTSTSAVGAQVFYSPNRDESRELGLSVQESVKRLIQPENTRTVKQGTKSTYLLHRAKIPAVIVECGFLSNKNEFALLKSEEYQSKMAFAVFCGIVNYFEE